MSLRAPFGVGEWYHCYTRGVDKRKTFLVNADYQRFIQTMFLANSEESIHRSDLWHLSHDDFFVKERGAPLVAIGGYCLMPNHFHILLQEISEKGISRFMQKLGTSYTMYFNVKSERVGSLFVKPFRSRHIDSDDYLRKVAQYIHLNPAELIDGGWKQGNVKSKSALEKELSKYVHSSLPDYLGIERPEGALLQNEARELITDGMPRLSDVIDEALAYYAEVGVSDKIVKASP